MVSPIQKEAYNMRKILANLKDQPEYLKYLPEFHGNSFLPSGTQSIYLKLEYLDKSIEEYIDQISGE